jgi:UDP-glucose 4-epimerase
VASAFQGKRALVTGGLGFIGSGIVNALVEAGTDVTVIDCLDPDYGGNEFNVSRVRDRIQVHVADIRDGSVLAPLVAGQDYVFNLAAQTGHVASMRAPLVDCDINVRAQLGLLELCRELNPGVRIVFASTRQVYGIPEYLPVDEAHPVRPVDVNGISKHAAEEFHLLYQRVYGIPCTVLRLTNTYGPGMRIKDARQTFLGVWVRRVLEGMPFEVWGGAQVRDVTYVDDAVNAFLKVAEADGSVGQVYNVGGGEKVDLARLAQLLVEANKGGSFEVREFPEERRRIDIGDFFADARRIATAVDWIPQVSIAEGLRRTLEYYRENFPLYV